VGQELHCPATIGGETVEVRALLESEELIVRGPTRLRIRFTEVTRVAAAGGRLEVTCGDETVSFELGDRAERWADRIRNPKTLVDKLDLKPGARVSILGVEDGEFTALVRSRAGTVTVGAPEPGSDTIFVQADTTGELSRIHALEASIARDGAVWVVAPKGRSDIREADVLDAGRAAGLVDTKVVRFSDTHTAHKFVIPKERR
jgi:hypothetical protein